MRVCSHCKAEFPPNSDQHVYCSLVCKARAKSRRHDERRAARKREQREALRALAEVQPPPPPRKADCLACGTEFTARAQHHTYCSPECRRHATIWAGRREVRTCANCGAETLGSRRKWRCTFGCSRERAEYWGDRPVYFIQAGENGPIKIGVSHDVAARLANLQTAHWEELRLLGTAAGGFDLERDLHARLAAHRLKGEWFAVSPSDLPLHKT